MSIVDDARQCLSLLDLTRLQENDSSDGMRDWLQPSLDYTNIAAYCVYPLHIKTVKNQLSSSTQVATVVNFPGGGDDDLKIITDIKQALSLGADEIDLVFPYQVYLQGNKSYALGVVALCRSLIGQRTLKVILETGVLPPDLISQIGVEVLQHGADFLKTSTGKVEQGASQEAVSALCQSVLTHYEQTQILSGIKISGGVSSIKIAQQYLMVLSDTFGDEYLKPTTCRIGASSLFNEIHRVLSHAR